MGFEVSMCTQGFFDVTGATVLGVELDGLEIIDIVCDNGELIKDVGD